MGIEIKQYSGNIIECKEIDRNGIPIGIIKGYIATWDVDEGGDQYVKGCFLEDLEKKRMLGRNIPFKNSHGKVIGKFPIETVIEDETGLYGEGEANLEVQEGRETYSLAKQKAIQTFSIGYITLEKSYEHNVRKILKSKILEGSAEAMPMNERATITEVKSRDMLPSSFCGFDHIFNESNIDNDKAYICNGKLQIADIIEGELKIIPRAVIQSRIELINGIDGMSHNEIETARKTINSLYKEMGLEIPFENGESKKLNKTEIKSVRTSTLVDILRNNFSKDTASYIADLVTSDVRGHKSGDTGMLNELCDMLKKTKEKIN